MIVADVMCKKVHTISPNENLAKLRKIFTEVNYRHLLVEQDSQLVGVISDRDVLTHLSPFLDTTEERNCDRDQLELEVQDIMSSPTITVDPCTDVDCASILLLENPVSALPVVTTELKIVGIISWKDILQYHVYGAN